MTQSQTTDLILLIDDDPITNIINTKVIKMNFDYQVESFVDGKKALEHCQHLSNINIQGFPNIIFLDINMPVMDGWEFMEEYEMLTRDPIVNAKIYMLSSSIDPADIEKSKSYKSVHGFVSKPLTVSKIKALTNQDAE
jgi:CheY-like chemotaxis protein